MSAKIAAALHAVMSKVSYIQKTGENKFHGYRYAGEADLLDKLRPAMIEAGLLLLPSAEVTKTDEHGNTFVSVEYTLAHKDGDIWPHPLRSVGCGNDKASNGKVGDKGVYKAVTGANKYLLFKLFQIETGDDPENDTAQSANDEHRPAYDETYLNATLKVIADWKSNAAALKQWWDDEAKFRKEAGIVNEGEGVTAYAKLFGAFKAKGIALAGQTREAA